MSIYDIYMIQFLRLFFLGGFTMWDKLAYEWGIPIAISFFLLMSLAVLEVTLALSPEVTMLSRYFVTIWISIEMLLVGWLIVLFSLPKQTSSVKSEGIINE